MEEKFRNLPLRSGVGIVVLNKENKVFVAKRIDNPKNFWQMPQGGVDDGEDFLAAAYRELEEETSIKNVELVTEIAGTITYELPKNLLGIIWKGKYKGQKQKWFLMRYLGKDEDYFLKYALNEGEVLMLNDSELWHNASPIKRATAAVGYGDWFVLTAHGGRDKK